MNNQSEEVFYSIANDLKQCLKKNGEKSHKATDVVGKNSIYAISD